MGSNPKTDEFKTFPLTEKHKKHKKGIDKLKRVWYNIDTVKS